MKGHEARKDMKQKEERKCLKRGKDEKGNRPGTNEAKPRYNDPGRPASLYMLCVHLRLRQVSLSLEKALVAATTSWHEAYSRPLRTRSGMRESGLLGIQ